MNEKDESKEPCFSLSDKQCRSVTVVPINSERDESANSSKLIEERMCRICLEAETAENKLISPCRCAGSVKYVHEECLKTWLASLDDDIENGKCELCSTKFLMDYQIKWRLLPKEACREGVAQILFIPLLLAVMIMLCLILYLLASKYLVSSSGEEEGYIIALMLTCAFSVIVLAILVVNAIKKLCFAVQLEDWHIHNQNFEVEEQVIKEKSEQVLEMTISVPPLLVIPKSLKLRGRRVRTPHLNPLMTPVNRGKRIVAFTPRYTPGASMVSGSQSNLTPMYTDPCTIRDSKNHSRKNDSKLPFLDESFFE